MSLNNTTPKKMKNESEIQAWHLTRNHTKHERDRALASHHLAHWNFHISFHPLWDLKDTTAAASEPLARWTQRCRKWRQEANVVYSSALIQPSSLTNVINVNPQQSLKETQLQQKTQGKAGNKADGKQVYWSSKTVLNTTPKDEVFMASLLAS